MVPDLPPPKPRSPLRVAVITFGAVVLIGTILSLAILGINGRLSDDPHARGERVGQGIGVLGAICAAVSYVTQHKRNTRR
ncbi:hypothetical protein BH11MYX3_BH11MYX3_47860 [soil metagenome]